MLSSDSTQTLSLPAHLSLTTLSPLLSLFPQPLSFFPTPLQPKLCLSWHATCSLGWSGTKGPSPPAPQALIHSESCLCPLCFVLRFLGHPSGSPAFLHESSQENHLSRSSEPFYPAIQQTSQDRHRTLGGVCQPQSPHTPTDLLSSCSAGTSESLLYVRFTLDTGSHRPLCAPQTPHETNRNTSKRGNQSSRGVWPVGCHTAGEIRLRPPQSVCHHYLPQENRGTGGLPTAAPCTPQVLPTYTLMNPTGNYKGRVPPLWLS